MKVGVKNLIIVIVLCLMGALLIAGFFIPIITPSSRYEDFSSSYSCKDLVVANRGDKDYKDMTPEEQEAYKAISDATSKKADQQKAGKIATILGTIGLINCFVGALLIICSVLWLFMAQNMMKMLLIIFGIVGFALSITTITLICVYLGIPKDTMQYSYFHSIGAGSFISLGVCAAASIAPAFLKNTVIAED